MQHNIKKIKEILVPYTAEENAELSGGEDTVPPPLPPRRPPPRAASAEAPDAPPLPQRTPQTEAEGRAAMKAYKEAWEKANAEAANRPITSDNPAGDETAEALSALAPRVGPRIQALTLDLRRYDHVKGEAAKQLQKGGGAALHEGDVVELGAQKRRSAYVAAFVPLAVAIAGDVSAARAQGLEKVATAAGVSVHRGFRPGRVLPGR